MDAERCPKCDASAVYIGRVTQRPRGLNQAPSTFIPQGVRILRWKVGVPLSRLFRACSSCGHVWTSLSSGELRAFIARYGDELAKQGLEPEGVGAVRRPLETHASP